MRNALGLALILALTCQCSASTSQQTSNITTSLQELLKSSTDRDALEHAAVMLAHSGNAGDLELLLQLLRDREFLARLDDMSNLQTLHLSRVMAALAEHPTPQIVDLSLTLAEDPVFVAEGDRKSFVLDLLASVKPMTERTAAMFQRSNAEGYFAFNARLLPGNGSPNALKLFEAMMTDTAVPVADRTECLHKGVLPRRIEPSILASADRILSRTREPAIATAVIESLFDFQQRWFGIESGVSGPPAWESGSPDSLRSALALAEKALARPDLSPALRTTVSRARENITRDLNSRKK